MTTEQLLNLPSGTYKATFEDLPRYKFDVLVEHNKVFESGPRYKKWITIMSEEPETIHSKVHVSVSDNNYVLFSSEAVIGLGIASNTPPTWLEYFKII